MSMNSRIQPLVSHSIDRLRVLLLLGGALISALSAAPVAAVPCSACHLETASHFKTSKHGLAFDSTGEAATTKQAVQGDA